MAGVEYLGEEQRDRLLVGGRAGNLSTPILFFLMYDAHIGSTLPVKPHTTKLSINSASAVGLFQWWWTELTVNANVLDKAHYSRWPSSPTARR